MDSEIIDRARALVGTRFRPQGREPQFGLDCIGVVLLAHALPNVAIPSDYRLRGDHRNALEQALRQYFRRIPRAGRRAGDVLLLKVAADQFHLAIHTDGGFIHADARHGRVVETPGRPLWATVGVYRRRRASSRGR